MNEEIEAKEKIVERLEELVEADNTILYLYFDSDKEDVLVDIFNNIPPTDDAFEIDLKDVLENAISGLNNEIIGEK
jgi:hypothetical protein